MKHNTYKKVILWSLMISAFSFFHMAQIVQAQNSQIARTRIVKTYTTQYQADDSGRYHMDSALQKEINELADEPKVTNLRIPILFGVKVSDLEDTWGDARSEGRTHEGIDILVPRGTLIVSPTDAVVTTVENSGNGGNHVFTANPGGERYYYAHLDSFAKGLTEGQVLKAGDLIGYVGNTGNAADGPTHLHFGIYEEGDTAVNPSPRLTEEFSTEDRIKAVSVILGDADDAVTLARTLVGEYRDTFLDAQTKGIPLPASVLQVLSEKKTEALGITRTLKLGMSGDDVKWLQGALGVSADGSFGPKTKTAVIAFQASHNLTADGVFGPASRAVLAESSLADVIRPSGCTATTAYSPTTGIKC